ncbi:hypothetical protein CDAR_516011 [Caerostris darwini]|uniref:Uncharacterized protein n=1 Tax=Caerostris darwini TaxID=1538125 RepID=A0AAV4NHV2_9ARAC|nr:hypothetical protein CDAR_516011 [Caerostris darwini]
MHAMRKKASTMQRVTSVATHSYRRDKISQLHPTFCEEIVWGPSIVLARAKKKKNPRPNECACLFKNVFVKMDSGRTHPDFSSVSPNSNSFFQASTNELRESDRKFSTGRGRPKRALASKDPLELIPLLQEQITSRPLWCRALKPACGININNNACEEKLLFFQNE